MSAGELCESGELDRLRALLDRAGLKALLAVPLLREDRVLGALLVVLADLASRLVVAPAELPVGIVTSLIGGPFFIYLIKRLRHRVEL